MPSRASQGAIAVFTKKKKPTGKAIVVTKKTGFVYLTINGKPYYYNEMYPASSINQLGLPNAFGGGSKAQQKKKKGKITVTKKKGK